MLNIISKDKAKKVYFCHKPLPNAKTTFNPGNQ